MKTKIITLPTELNNNHAKNQKLRLAVRILGWSLFIVPAGFVGYLVGGIFGLAFAVGASFLLAKIVDSIFSKKLW